MCTHAHFKDDSINPQKMFDILRPLKMQCGRQQIDCNLICAMANSTDKILSPEM